MKILELLEFCIKKDPHYKYELTHMEFLTKKRKIGAYFWPLGAPKWRLFYSCRRQIGAYFKYVKIRHS